MFCFRDEFRWLLYDQIPQFGQLIERGRIDVSWTLGADELISIIRAPAESVGWHFEENLVKTIVAEIVERVEGDSQLARSTILPLLEVALQQLSAQPPESRLTFEAYDRIGRVTGALSVWADRAYFSLSPQRQLLAKDLLLDLVQIGDEAQGIPDNKRRRFLGDLCWEVSDRSEVRTVVDHLVQSRLLVTLGDPGDGQSSVEIIHDALFREWRLLHEALHNSVENPTRRAFLRWSQMLDPRIRRWVASRGNRILPSPEELLRGVELAEAEAWLARLGENLTRLQRNYIRASIAQRKREQKLWTRIAAGLAAVAVTLLISTVWALVQTDAARESAKLAIERDVETKQALEREKLRAGPRQRRWARRDGDSGSYWWVTPRGDGARASFWSLCRSSSRPSARPGRKIRIGIRITSGWPQRRAAPRLLQAWTFQFPVNHAPTSGDGRRVAVALGLLDVLRADRKGRGEVRVFDAVTGAMLGTPLVHPSPVARVALDRKGERAATIAADGIVRVWDIGTGRLLGSPLQIGKAVADENMANDAPAVARPDAALSRYELLGLNVFLTSDGQRVLGVSDEGVFRAWEIRPDNSATTLVTESRPWRYVVLDPQGRRIVGVADSKASRVWDLDAPGAPGRDLPGSRGARYVALNPDGNRAAILGEQPPQAIDEGPGGLRSQVWDLISAVPFGKPLLHAPTLRYAAFNPDGEHVLLAEYDPPGDGPGIEPAPAIGPPEISVFVWDIKTGQVAKIDHTDAVNWAAFSPDGQGLFLGGNDGVVSAWQFEKTPPQPYALPLPLRSSVTSVDSLPDGHRVLTVTADHVVRLWELASSWPVSGSLRVEVPPVRAYKAPGDTAAAPLQLPALPIDDVDFDSQGGRIATLGPDYEAESSLAKNEGPGAFREIREPMVARIWDAFSGEPLIPPLRHPAPKKGDIEVLTDVRFSQNGQYLATTSFNLGSGSLRIWDTSTGKPCSPQVRVQSNLWGAAFSPDGVRLATAGSSGQDKGEVRLWRVPGGEPAWEHSIVTGGETRRVVFSPDGRHVAAAWEGANNRGEAMVWSVEDGQPASELLIAPGGGSEFGFSPDGRYLLMAGADDKLRLWVRSERGSDPRTITHLGGDIRTFAFSHDGKRIAVGDGGRTARVWSLAGEPITPPLRHIGPVSWVGFSPDDRLLASVSSITEVVSQASVWEVDGGQAVVPSSYYDRQNIHASFLKDGRLVIVTERGEVNLFDFTASSEGSDNVMRDYALSHAMMEIDATFGAAPIDARRFAQLWDALRKADASITRGASVDVLDLWHLSSALDSLREQQYFAVRWHLDRIISLQDDVWLKHLRDQAKRGVVILSPLPTGTVGPRPAPAGSPPSSP